MFSQKLIQKIFFENSLNDKLEINNSNNRWYKISLITLFKIHRTKIIRGILRDSNFSLTKYNSHKFLSNNLRNSNSSIINYIIINPTFLNKLINKKIFFIFN